MRLEREAGVRVTALSQRSSEVLPLRGRDGSVFFADSAGVIYKGRKERMNAAKEAVAADTPHRTLADAMRLREATEFQLRRAA